MIDLLFLLINNKRSRIPIKYIHHSKDHIMFIFKNLKKLMKQQQFYLSFFFIKFYIEEDIFSLSMFKKKIR